MKDWKTVFVLLHSHSCSYLQVAHATLPSSLTLLRIPPCFWLTLLPALAPAAPQRVHSSLQPDVKSIVIDSEAVAWDKVKKKILPFQVSVGGY